MTSGSKVPSARPRSAPLTDHDIYLFREGSHMRLYERLGAHLDVVEGVAGCRFAVWARDPETGD